jgi:hypothetical protein
VPSSGREASRGLFILLFLGRRGHSHCAFDPLIPHAVPKDPKEGLILTGVMEAIMLIKLDLACLTKASGKIMMSQDVNYPGSLKKEQELVWF